MRLLEKLRNMASEEERVEEVAAPAVVVAASPELVEVVSVPRELVPSAWSIIEKDAALSFLEAEYKLVSIKARVISCLARLVEPDPDHPRLRAMIYADLRDWIDEENLDLYALLRLARSKHGFERRLTTVTAPRWAVKGW